MSDAGDAGRVSRRDRNPEKSVTDTGFLYRVLHATLPGRLQLLRTAPGEVHRVVRWAKQTANAATRQRISHATQPRPPTLEGPRLRIPPPSAVADRPQGARAPAHRRRDRELLRPGVPDLGQRRGGHNRRALRARPPVPPWLTHHQL